MRRLSAIALVLLLLPSLAAAQAPEPRRPVDLPRFMGRWFEILRTPNMAEGNCYAASQLWSPAAPGRVSIAQTCHRNSATGPERHVMTPARVLDDPTDAKFEASFFGGLFHRQYWVLDHADDYGWMIASTADGNYVSVLARTPALPAAEVASLTARVTALGLDAGRLVPVPSADGS